MSALLALVLGFALLGWSLRDSLSSRGNSLTASALFGSYLVVQFIVPIALDLKEAPEHVARAHWASLAAAGGMTAAWKLWRAFGLSGSLDEMTATSEHLLQNDEATRRRVVGLFALLGLASLIGGAALSAGGVRAALEAERFEFRESTSPLVAVVSAHGSRLMLVAAYAASLGRSGSARSRALLLVVSLATAAFLFSRGGRALSLGIVGIGCVGLVQSNVRPGGRRTIMRSAVVGLLVLWLATGMYSARKTLSSDVGQSVDALIRGPFDASLIETDPLNYFHFTVAAAREFQYGPAEGQMVAPLRRLVFAPFKSGGLKPLDTHAQFGSLLGRSGTTIPPSIPGEGLMVVGGLMGAMVWGFVTVFTYGIVVQLGRRHLGVAVAVSASAIEMGLLGVRGQYYELYVSLISLSGLTTVGLALISGFGRLVGSPGVAGRQDDTSLLVHGS